MESEFLNNFRVFDHDHKLQDIVLEARYIHGKNKDKVRSYVFVGAEYSNADQLIDDMEALSVKMDRDGYNCYQVMNTISKDIIKGHEGQKRIEGLSVGDKDVAEINQALIDVDRKGNTKVPASQSEMDEAHTIAIAIIGLLMNSGFPKPSLVMSGNGYHIYVPLDHWENTEDTKQLRKTFLKHIGELFDTNTHKVDTTVHNASRITKQIGTYAKKGESTSVRPWRKATMIQQSNGALLSVEKMKEFLPDKPALKVKPPEPPSHSNEALQGFDALVNQPLLGEEVELEKLKKALTNFSPDDDRGDGTITGGGADWLGIIFAGASLGNFAKDTVREWSMRSTKYEDAEFEKAWNSYGKNTNNPITVGSLYHCIKEQNQPLVDYDAQLGDYANGVRFANKFRSSILFIRDSNDLVIWEDGVGWTDVHSDYPMMAAKAVFRDMQIECARAMERGQEVTKMQREVKRTGGEPIQRRMITMARSEEGMSASLPDFDTDPYLLGVKNGILDLRKGVLVPLTPDLLIRKRCSVIFDPSADAPRFRQFLEEIVPDKELRAFLVRFLGYCLTGSIKEHRWLFLIGEGRNGKSVLLRVMEKLLGRGYGQKVISDVLMQGAPKNSSGPQPEILQLQGARFIFGSETREGQKWDDARIKEITGGDPLTGRWLNQNAKITFDPNFKLVIAGNNFPIARDNSKGFWDRIIVFPFNVNFTDQQIDKHLEDKLFGELVGVLNVLLEGLKDYEENGLGVPKALTDAINEYRDQSDLIKQFIRDECDKDISLLESKKDVYARYKIWCIENGLSPLSSMRFSRQLGKQDDISVMSDQRTWSGIKLNPEESPFAELQRY